MTTTGRAHSKRKRYITPFWERMPSFFGRPFQRQHLFWLGGLSLASALPIILPFPTGLGILIAQFMVWMAGTRHAFGAMEACARGHMDQPDAEAWRETDPDRRNLPWKLVAIFLVCGLVISVVSQRNAALIAILSTVLSLLMPAITMQLSASNSFTESMNVNAWWHFIRHIGWPYLALCFFLTLLVNGVPVVIKLLAPMLVMSRSMVLALPVLNFVGLYFMLISFLLMGYVMYQYHEPLGLWAADPEAEAMSPKALLEEEIGELVAAGKTPEALALAEQALRDQPYEMDNQERVYKLLLLGGKSERLYLQGQALFERMLGLGRDARALDIYRDLTGLGYALVLDGAQSLKLAQTADRQQDVTLAVQLVRSFDKRFPQHPAIPDVYFFSARLSSERLRRHDQAVALLKALQSRFPEHPIVHEAQRYLQVLEKMTAVQASN